MPNSQPNGAQPKTLSKSEQTRSQILTAAAKLFRDEGYNASTLRKIAGKAGMEAGSIYYHFASKDVILDEVLDTGLRQIFDAVKQTSADAKANGLGFRDAFSAMVNTHLIYLLQASDSTSTNIRSFPTLPEEMRNRHRPLRRAYADLWDDFLADARRAGEIRDDIKVVPLRQFVLGALNWTVEWYDAERYPIEMLSQRAAKLILDGMSTEHGAVTLSVINEPDIKTRQPVERGRKATRSRKQILSAAARIMRDRGYSSATLRDIADEAGMEARSVYYHFDSKDQILDEVLDVGLRDLLDGVKEVMAQDHGKPQHRARIAAAIRRHIQHLFAKSEFTSANIRMYGQLPKEIRARHLPVRHDYGSIWDRCLSAAQDAGEIRPDIKVVPLRQVMLGALNWTVEWFDPEMGGRDDAYNLDEMVRMLQILLLDGIVAR
ncbi:MAG: TetR family transcriptional regulator [Marinosulfonomonas sp.]|nr:TetR family transcriptional regulator [Marinosulfonomonas sp.]